MHDAFRTLNQYFLKKRESIEESEVRQYTLSLAAAADSETRLNLASSKLNFSPCASQAPDRSTGHRSKFQSGCLRSKTRVKVPFRKFDFSLRSLSLRLKSGRR